MNHAPGTPWQPIRPDARAIAVVIHSLDRPEALPELAAAFVSHLAQLAGTPDLAAALTPPAAERLLDAIRGSMITFGNGSDEEAADRAEDALRDLGTWLSQAGLAADGLRGIGYALVRAAREHAGRQWTTSVGSAWASVQAWLVEQLVQGAGRQPTLVTPMGAIPTIPEEAGPADRERDPERERGPERERSDRYERLVQRLTSGPFGRRR